ncbi:uncharacterized protein H6S33_010387 [Morchella sextelata]|uniref:uncharacterized protein n=1 Tax=Morchella sextelata TaxID=1174677 RepID=UPI001D044BE3|nr:uncharacterized protein H6S33_010387 [Morchella sextelata]KAH0612335.1 hypothetical protein H6S33_010387 [Morchella sextelata]
MSLPHTRSRSPSPSPAASTILPADDTIATPLSPAARADTAPLLYQKVIRWIKGPVPPRDTTLKPWFPEYQEIPAKLLRRGPFKQRSWRAALLGLFWFVWLTTFVAVVHNSRFRSRVDGVTPYMASCADTMWAKNNGCGLDGASCGPFQNYTQPFRCPAQCARTHVLNPRVVGDQVIIYDTFVIGGPVNNVSISDQGAEDIDSVYRSDSFICSAAIHAGVISDKYGGCGVYSMVGENHYFPSVRKHGISSIGFDSVFPSSFTFLKGVSTSHCTDLRWHLLAVSLVFTVLLSLTTTTPVILFPSVFCALFFHVALGSDPEAYSNPYELVSLALSRFLPACFVAYVLFKHVISYTLALPSSANIEKTILWLGPLWVGALNNITIDPLIPITRLTSRDIQQQPGAISALVIVCSIITLIVLYHAHALRLEGRLPRYLALYAAIGIVLGFLAAIPGSSLRIHHYIIGITLLPGTKMRTRVSLICSGLLIGLFINGVARWGFAGIIETPESLRGDGLYFSTLPVLVAPQVGAANATFAWEAGKLRGWEEGVSVLINDVERFRVPGLTGEATWERTRYGAEEEWEKLYVRVGYYGGGEAGDYTLAGVLEGNGTWVQPGVGRS